MNQETNIVTVAEDYSVIVNDNSKLQAFFADRENLKKLYSIVEKQAKLLAADVHTKAGITSIKSCARQIASVKAKVDDLGKQVVAELKALPKIIDTNRAEFRKNMELLQDEIRKPVTEIEEREKQLKYISERHLTLGASSSEEIEIAIKELSAMILDECIWHESLDKAKKVIETELSALDVCLKAAQKREKDALGLELLRQKQEEAERIIREQKIREEAEQKAAAELKAREQVALERERILKEQEAQVKLQKERLEREKTEALARAQAAGKAAEEAKNQAAQVQKEPIQVPSKWTPEMKTINNAIVKSIAEILGHSNGQGYEFTAREIVKAIANGKIQNLKIIY